MEPFSLPEEFIIESFNVKHKLVKDYIRNFKKMRTNKKRMRWDTLKVIDLLTHLNLKIEEPFKFIKDNAPFSVCCQIHFNTFETSLEKISKGYICKSCLNTERIFTQEQAEELANQARYKLLEKYRGYHEPHRFLCPLDHETYQPYFTIFQGKCKKCGNKRKAELFRTPYHKIVILFSKLQEKYTNIKLLTTQKEYENFEENYGSFKFRYTCIACNNEKKNSLTDIKAGHLLCSNCSPSERVADLRLTYAEVAKRFQEKNLKILLDEETFNLEYSNVLYEVKYQCKVCKFPGKKRVQDITNSGCPKCNSNFKNTGHAYKQSWSDKVKTSFNYTCFNCGYFGNRLHAHHIYSKKDFPEFEKEVWCGIALCPYCHINNTHAFHKYAKECTPEVFLNWINDWGDQCAQESQNIHALYKNTIISSPKNNELYLNSIPFKDIIITN